MPRPYRQSILARLTRPSREACWLWTGAVNDAGHGVTRLGRGSPRLVYVHRFMYALTRGPIPAGYDVHHVCEVKRCANPEHLELREQTDHRQANLLQFRVAGKYLEVTARG